MASRISDKKHTTVALSFGAITSALNGFSFPRCDVVVGIAQGGVVPAFLVAYRLGCDAKIIQILYRSEKNTPIFSEPHVIYSQVKVGKKKRLLIVDDVARTGKTLQVARRLFPRHEVHTMVFIGSAEYVLFPKIDSCVQWPWKVDPENQ